jgi:hypothetical protein
MPYNSKQAAVDALKPGYRVVGEKPYFVNKANPNAGRPGEPAQIQEQQGVTLSILGPKGEPDTIVVKEVGNNPDTKGGVGFDVIEGPQSKPTAGNQASPPGGWTPVYRTPGDASSGQIGQWDPQNNEFHPTAADPNAKPSGTYDNVIDPNDPKGKRIIGMIDKGDKSWHAVSNDPNLPGRQIITTPSAVYAVDADNNVSKLVDIDKNSPFQAVIVDGKPFKFDPNTGTFTAGPVNEHPDIKDANNLPMVWTVQPDGSAKYAYPPGVKPAAGLSVNTTAPNLIWYDTDGNVVATRKNENYLPTPATAPSPNTTAPMLLLPDPKDPTKLTWQPNKGQVLASDALKQLASHLTGQVVSGDMTVDEAKTLIDSANARMTNDINQANTARGAASDILTAMSTGATTGAGILQNRVSNAQQMLGSVLGLAGQGQRSGNMGGGLMSAPAGLGEQLVGGIQGWATELGGGQGVYDTAARLVQAADPQNGRSPEAQAAYGVLTQMLDRYKQQTGQDHPTVVATQAAQQSQQQGGMAAPATVVPPQQAAPVMQPAPVAAGVVAPPNQVPGANYGNAIAYTGGVAPASYGFTPPGGSSYSYGGPVPWAGAVPQPLPPGAFTAPRTLTAADVLAGRA